MPVDASYEENKKYLQRNQQHTKPSSLTLGEVSHEIHYLKKEIVELKEKIPQIGKGKLQEPAKNPNVDIFEDIQISGIWFGNMNIMTIEYQQNHVLLTLDIQGENFSLRTLIDSGVDIYVLNKKVIPAK